jgi:hypothetical protein
MYGILDSSGNLLAKFTVPLNVRSNQPVTVSDALSLKRFTSKSTAHRWEIEAGLEPLSEGAEDLMVELMLKGLTETVNILMPQNYSVKNKNVLNSTSLPLASGSAGSTQINITNFLGLIQKGSFFKFNSSNITKIYMVTNTINAMNLDTTYTMNIYPSLRTSVSSLTFNFRNDVIIPCLIDSESTLGMNYTDGVLMSIDRIKLLERL